MILLEKIQSYIDQLSEKQFKQYVGIFLGLICLISGIIVFQYYRKVNYLKKQINAVNESREEVKEILARAQQVKLQQKEVNEMLAEDEDFKIGGYFQDLLAKLQLSNKATELATTGVERPDNYSESVLNVKFSNMTMKELTELLQALEQKKRIYTKDLEITTSKKIPNTIEVNLTIATLQPETEETE